MKTIRMKRGQSALEYLVTYGWAILAIVIVAGVLWYLGVFNPQKYAGGAQCGGFSTAVCRDYTAAGGTVSIAFGNAAGGAISGLDISIAGTDGSCTPAAVGANEVFTCTGSATTTQGLDINATLTYTSASGLAHSETGFVRGQGA